MPVFPQSTPDAWVDQFMETVLELRPAADVRRRRNVDRSIEDPHTIEQHAITRHDVIEVEFRPEVVAEDVRCVVFLIGGIGPRLGVADIVKGGRRA
ncbi:hypothetical protein ANO11243_080660 [Dothideomycetidae sp. 11243]|nr:hypothetical protein ANO11243_080660 [fungal sp. No.11243]